MKGILFFQPSPLSWLVRIARIRHPGCFTKGAVHLMHDQIDDDDVDDEEVDGDDEDNDDEVMILMMTQR